MHINGNGGNLFGIDSYSGMFSVFIFICYIKATFSIKWCIVDFSELKTCTGKVEVHICIYCRPVGLPQNVKHPMISGSTAHLDSSEKNAKKNEKSLVCI